MGVSFCFEEILFRQREQALRDIALEVSQINGVLFSASAQGKTTCSCGRVYVSQGVVWYLQGQFSTIVVSSARSQARESQWSPVRSDAARAALRRRLLHRSRACHAATQIFRRAFAIKSLCLSELRCGFIHAVPHTPQAVRPIRADTATGMPPWRRLPIARQERTYSGFRWDGGAVCAQIPVLRAASHRHLGSAAHSSRCSTGSA